MNFVTSIDGAVTVDGKSAGLGGPGDKQIFDVLRMVCDALVVAAGTVRAENYDALRLDAPAAGVAHGPRADRVPADGGRLRFAGRSTRTRRSSRTRRSGRSWSPTPARTPGRRAAIAEVADVVAVGDGEVDLAAALAELRDRGATQVLCEGGPHLVGAMTAADVVDEICLTVSPLLAGGDAGRMAAGPPGPVRPMALRHVLTDEDMLFLRYARRTLALVDNPVDDH